MLAKFPIPVLHPSYIAKCDTRIWVPGYKETDAGVNNSLEGSGSIMCFGETETFCLSVFACLCILH